MRESKIIDIKDNQNGLLHSLKYADRVIIFAIAFTYSIRVSIGA